MDIAAHHAPVGAGRAVRAPVVERRHRPYGIGTARLAQVHLIAFEARAERGSGDLPQHLLGRQHRLDVEQAQPLDAPCRPLDSLRVGQALAQHLIAAAQAQHRAAAPVMRENVDVPALGPERGQIGDRRLGTRKHDQRRFRRNRLTWRNHPQLDTGLELQWVEVVEIGNARQDRTGDQPRPRPVLPPALEDHRVLARQPRGRCQPRHHAEAPPARKLLDPGIAIGEQLRVAAELVDDETADHRGILAVDHRACPDDRRDYPAAVDVADQDDGHVRRAREPHIGDVADA